jgi:S1-C subfamily serine protease
MKSFVIAAILFTASCAFGQKAVSNSTYIKETLYPAVGLLYLQDAEGGLRMRCTATAIDLKAGVTTFVTAAHCGCTDNAEKKQVTPERGANFYITGDDPDDKAFEKAAVVGCGYRHKGDDFMLLEVKSKKNFPTVRLGSDPDLLDSVVNIASPLGLGKQAFLGSVASPSLERPVIEGDINWEHVVTLQMFGVNGGSSGSAVICLNQQAICAFVVGSIEGTTMTAMPVSRLKLLIEALKNNKYKYWVADPDAIPDHPADVPKTSTRR